MEKYTLCSRKWAAIVCEYTVKSVYTQTVLYTEFLELKLLESENVCKFMNNLYTCREELSQSGVDVSDADYRSTIISSLPRYLSTFASSQLTAAMVNARNAALWTGKPLTLEEID